MAVDEEHPGQPHDHVVDELGGLETAEKRDQAGHEPGLALYSASKYAVRAFSLAAAEDLRPHGVAVTTVCPDAVKTPMFDHQIGYREAALTFTAPKVLSVEEVSRVILGKVLARRPLIVAIPRWRGWLARLADLFPSTAKILCLQ